MSSLVLMRILESSPARYDRGMALLTLGAWGRAHRAVAHEVEPGARVLEIGCGTGALTAQLLSGGAVVLALDCDPAMLDRARARFADVKPERLELRECTASEIDGFDEAAFDAVALSFVLSEMSASERAFVLRESRLRLRPGGKLVVADEVVPRRLWQRVLHGAVRLPLLLLSWLVTGSTTRSLPDLAGELENAGLVVRSETRSSLGTFAVLVAERTQ